MKALILALMLLCSSLSVSADVLESPAQGASLSGLGFIAGWKCDAGSITVRIDGGAPIPVATGQPRADTRQACGSENAGFLLQYDWSWLDDGAHTAVAYDDGEEFARSTFTVENGREETGELIPCTVGLRLHPGQSCTGRHGRRGHDYTFWVNQFSYSCAKGHTEEYEEGWCDPEHSAGYLDAEQNTDGSWTIEEVPHPDPDDHGDTEDTATVVQLVPGSSVSETLWFSAAYDRDHFALEVPAGVQDRLLTIEINSRSMRARVYQLPPPSLGYWHIEIADTGPAPHDGDIQLQFAVSADTYYLVLSFSGDWELDGSHLPHTVMFHLAG